MGHKDSDRTSAIAADNSGGDNLSPA